MTTLISLRRILLDKFWAARLSETAAAVREKRLTYLPPAKLFRLERALARVNRSRIEGDCVECGVALGGSSILIAKHAAPERRFIGFDLFGTIPPPSTRDGADSHARYEVIAAGKATGIAGDQYYGYEPDLYDKVKSNLADFGLSVDNRRVQLVKGLFEDTVQFDDNTRIAFAHIDCDWHDPVETCLTRIYPHLAKGGVVVLDDYNDYSGCRGATAAFLSTHHDMRILDASHNAILIRV